MLTGKTKDRYITGFAERTPEELVFILLQLTVPKQLGVKQTFAS
jgi:hypothetical protein